VQLQALPLQSKKKHPVEAFGKAARIIDHLDRLACAGQCELLFFDESGFSPNPPLQAGWSPVGQTRSVALVSHGERVNVLGALRHDGTLRWKTQRRPTVRDDVIGFFDELAALPHAVPRIVVLDNASFHKGDAIARRRRAWMAQGLFLYYLPPYSPELNRIEILWKQAKYFWRRFVALKGNELLDEVESLMQSYGTAFTINFV
jgi:transposase